MLLRFLFAMILLSAVPVALRADTISTYTAGTGSDYIGYYGQSFTVNGSGTFNNITFSFLNASGQSYALGTGYLFSQAYSSMPSSLGSSTAGYLGSASASGNLYSFASALTLTAGNTYYFYENAQIPSSVFAGGGTTAGGQVFYASSSTSNFAAQGISADYKVTGTAVTPEPSSLLLLATGLLSVGSLGVWKKHQLRQRQTTAAVK